MFDEVAIPALELAKIFHIAPHAVKRALQSFKKAGGNDLSKLVDRRKNKSQFVKFTPEIREFLLS